MEEEKPSPFADLLAGAFWLALAVAIVIAAWRMDRLERLAATIYSAPGLVPGLLGLCIGIMSVILIGRSLRAGALSNVSVPQFDFAENWRLISALVVGLIFSVFLVGHGLPFWLAAAIYIAVMVFIFQYPERRDSGHVLRGTIVALVYGAIMGVAIHYLFEDLFLVRLP